MVRGLILLIFAAAFLHVDAQKKPCVLKTVKAFYSVCVCNATYCDEIEPVGDVAPRLAVVYKSTAAGKRFERTQTKPASQRQVGDILLELDSTTRYQNVLGFGGAFTDAAGINLQKLPQALQNTIINQYYGASGLNYTFGRVPIASCDFSTHAYSYDDSPNDFALSNFSLQPEDLNYKIPYIKMAMQANKNLKLFGSPWSAPAWMKTTGVMKGGGPLKGDPNGPYFQTWAQYFVRFLEEYNKQGIQFWGVTVQNEPDTGKDVNFPWQTMYWTAEMERDFVKNQLGPAFDKSSVARSVGIIINDDNRNNLPEWPDKILGDPQAAKYVMGIGVHWYEDNNTPASALAMTHNNHPNTWILGTEACTGWSGIERGVKLGSWARAFEFASDIIEDFQNWVGGWVDWNLLLDSKGGPNWVKNYVDAPIIVSEDGKEIYKQPLWNAMGHFSKFIPAGSWRIKSVQEPDEDITSVSFVNDQIGGYRIVVILNMAQFKSKKVTIKDGSNYYPIHIEENCLATVIIG